MEKRECRYCVNAYWWDDRPRCRIAKRRVDSTLIKEKIVYTNVCTVVNPKEDCKYYEEMTFKAVLEPKEPIGGELVKEEEEKKGDSDGKQGDA